MPKPMVSNTKLIELLDYYMLTQQRELPEEFSEFNIPEGRNALLKLVQQRLGKLPKEKPDVSVPERNPVAERRNDIRSLLDLSPGWEVIHKNLLPHVSFATRRYATFELNKLNVNVHGWEDWRRAILQAIGVFIHASLNVKPQHWPAGVAKFDVLFEEMYNEITADVIKNMAKSERCVLVIGQPENMSLDDKLLDLEALHRLKKSVIELQGTYSGWTIQTVPEARFHE